MDHESVYRRCGCRDESTGRLLGARCPGLRDLKHGSWYFSADLLSAAGQRRRIRRGGFATKAAAVAAREALASPAAGPEPELSTGEWLGRWLESRVSLRASTARSYAAHVRGYLGRHPQAGDTGGGPPEPQVPVLPICRCPTVTGSAMTLQVRRHDKVSEPHARMGSRSLNQAVPPIWAAGLCGRLDESVAKEFPQRLVIPLRLRQRLAS
jgi:hypothetical protein